jgi:hypothetical protein
VVAGDARAGSERRPGANPLFPAPHVSVAETGPCRSFAVAVALHRGQLALGGVLSSRGDTSLVAATDEVHETCSGGGDSRSSCSAASAQQPSGAGRGQTPRRLNAGGMPSLHGVAGGQHRGRRDRPRNRRPTLLIGTAVVPASASGPYSSGAFRTTVAPRPPTDGPGRAHRRRSSRSPTSASGGRRSLPGFATSHFGL